MVLTVESANWLIDWQLADSAILRLLRGCEIAVVPNDRFT